MNIDVLMPPKVVSFRIGKDGKVYVTVEYKGMLYSMLQEDFVDRFKEEVEKVELEVNKECPILMCVKEFVKE